MRVWSYVRDLLDLFARWWWAAITGVASILSWLAIPSEGISVSPTTIALFVFGAMALVFLTASAMIRGYRWYVNGVQPRLARFIPASETDETVPCTFVVDFRPGSARPGYLLCLYRNVVGEDVCIAVLQLDRVLHDGRGQCVPLWISPGHLNELSQSRVDIGALRVRYEVPARIIEKVKE